MILPVVSPPAIAESSEGGDLELPVISRMPVYAGVSDFWPDRTDKSGWRLADWVSPRSSREPGDDAGPDAGPDVGSDVGFYDGLPGEKRLCDLVMQELEQRLRMQAIRGVSVDLRMVGISETADYLKLLKRVRKVAGHSRRLIASVPGELFCRDRLRKRVFRAAVAGFAIDDMLELVDVIVVRCWRDPLISDTDRPDAARASLTSLGFVRAAIAAAARAVPRWRLAAGFMCGAVIRHEADSFREDYTAAQHLDELTQRFVVRRRYVPEDDSLRAYLVSRKLECDFWYEDSRTLPKRLALVNRNNLVGVELFWPGQQAPLIEACRPWFEPLQEFEGSWLNTSTGDDTIDR